ncbi:hypothetical protein [Arthrobacter sp. EM1]|uniref:hypothetical protein n=1 Tax=Arthrobacter sp. EM1 TaxID=3043847 RepID=UPI00249EDB64|nr:hypothetical protein [Arthrobacter sp. EM1]WGZ80141.1 hypothetical protein QI450_02555 [Arthrobacter sp. EM1]
MPLRKNKGRHVLASSGGKMIDGGRPRWDCPAEPTASPAEESTALITDLVVRRLLDGSTPPWALRARIIADVLAGADRGGVPGRGRQSGPVDVPRHLYANVSWMFDNLQLEVPERTLSGSPYMTDGGPKILPQVQRLLVGE